MRFFLQVILIILFPYSGLQAQKNRILRVEVTNITAFQQLDEQITMKRKELEASVGKISDSVIPVIKDPQQICIPSQVDDLDGDQKWDELVFVYNMMPRQRAIFTISFLDKVNAPPFTSRTNMDIYKVSQKLGGGDLAIMEGDTLIKLGVRKEETTFINKGPVRAIFKVDHYGWDVSGKKYNVHQLVSIWAGRHGYENKVWMEGDSTNKSFIIGLVHNNDRNGLMIKKYVPALTALITYDQQSYNREYFLGLALLFPSDKYLGFPDTPAKGPGMLETCCAKLKMPVNNPLTFYVYSGWEPEDKGYRDADSFVKMITHEAAMINMPAKVRILEN